MNEPILDRMAAQLAAWDDAGDGRAVFLDCYCQMTQAVLHAVDDGRFADPSWVALLLDRFADYYFISIDGGDGAQPVPEPWVLAHAAAVGNDAHPLQLLLAGVSAHINYDLVLALVDLLDDEWPSLDAAGRERRRHDYDVINLVIAETADAVQDRVVERRAPELSVVDVVMLGWDERLAVRLLTGWRRQVWRHAVELLDDREPETRRARVMRIEHRCVRRARRLLL